MTELLTAAQMRAIEGEAIASGEVTGLELMERAGQGVVDAIMAEWPEFAAIPRHAVVLCGPGNNGGDGFVIARLLHGLGWTVEVYLYGDAEKLPPDARVNYERWLELGDVTALSLEAVLTAQSAQVGDMVVIDALFGTGLTRPLSADSINTLDAVACTGTFAHAKHVYVDLPSGVCADSGRGLWGQEPVGANDRLTVTFHRPKLGHYLGQGPQKCGKMRVADIGLQTPLTLSTAQLVAPDADAMGKGSEGHKFSHGHALILSGGLGRSGAARLAARAALRIGAGLVTAGAPDEAMPECAAQLTAIMLRQVNNAAQLTEMLDDPRINAICIGPGLGFSDQHEALVEAALRDPAPEGEGSGSHPERGLVLDADALTILSRRSDLFGALHSRCVLTPHAGEFKRLFPDIHERLNATPVKGPAYSKVDAVREAAKRAGCTILFKGPDTVIADQTGACSIHAAAYGREAPWLATAGSGDVLAGIIAGLLARGFPPELAAETGAWLHVEAARSFGPGLIAEDLPEQLPAVFATLNII